MTTEEDVNVARLEVALKHLEKNVDALTRATEKQSTKMEGYCEKCLVKKVVYGVVSLIGIATITALITLVIRAPVK